MLTSIQTEEQYDDALTRVYELMQMNIEENSTIAKELETLSILVKEYELEYYSINNLT